MRTRIATAISVCLLWTAPAIAQSDFSKSDSTSLYKLNRTVLTLEESLKAVQRDLTVFGEELSRLEESNLEVSQKANAALEDFSSRQEEISSAIQLLQQELKAQQESVQGLETLVDKRLQQSLYIVMAGMAVLLLLVFVMFQAAVRKGIRSQRDTWNDFQAFLLKK